jgi:hypothetical protein
MTIQASGALSFSEIAAEFGTPPGRNLGAYRISVTIGGLSNLALDNVYNGSGIVSPFMPTSGEIKFSDFYSKKLNVVVNYTVPSGFYTTRRNYSTAKSLYDNNVRTTSLGFKTRPTSPDNIKVWIHTDGTIGSDQAAANISDSTMYCTLLTGAWSNTTDLRLDIGSNGAIYGAGGNGGRGGDTVGLTVFPPSGGNNATSSIGIQHTPIRITNRGRIVAGGGGGGGGGSASANHEVHRGWGNNRNRYYYASAPGSGGAGGQGLPGGSKGRGGTGVYSFGRIDSWNSQGRSRNPVYGNDGTDGNINGNGSGGASRTFSDAGCSATGGAGGNSGLSGGNGSSSGRNERSTGGSPGGSNGYSFVISNDGTGVTFADYGTISGAAILQSTPK